RGSIRPRVCPPGARAVHRGLAAFPLRLARTSSQCAHHRAPQTKVLVARHCGGEIFDDVSCLKLSAAFNASPVCRNFVQILHVRKRGSIHSLYLGIFRFNQVTLVWSVGSVSMTKAEVTRCHLQWLACKHIS